MSTSAPETRTLRSFFHKRLTALANELECASFAALTTEDGLLIATHERNNPEPMDRRGAVMSSLNAVARAAAIELDLGEVQFTQIDCAAGRLLVQPFVTQQDSGPKRRLLFVVLDSDVATDTALAAMDQFIADIAKRVAPANG